MVKCDKAVAGDACVDKNFKNAQMLKTHQMHKHKEQPAEEVEKTNTEEVSKEDLLSPAKKETVQKEADDQRGDMCCSDCTAVIVGNPASCPNCGASFE